MVKMKIKKSVSITTVMCNNSYSHCFMGTAMRASVKAWYCNDPLYCFVTVKFFYDWRVQIFINFCEMSILRP